MNLIVTALRPEALPFIQRLKLKRVLSIRSHELYRHDSFSLIITGIGLTQAAIGTTLALQFFSNQGININTITNVGIAGSNGDFSLGSIVRPVKIQNLATLETFYPDITVDIRAQDGILHSSPTPIASPDHWPTDTIADMEGAAFFEASKSFLPIENILLLKIISDFFKPETITRDRIEEHIRVHTSQIIETILTLEQVTQKIVVSLLTESDEQLLADCETRLSLTSFQRTTLRNHAKQFRARTQAPLPLSSLLRSAHPETKVEQKKILQEVLNVLAE